MSKREKRIQKLLTDPSSLHFREIESIFSTSDYTIERGIWSHKHIIHNATQTFSNTPIHNWDCQDYYKKELKFFYIKTNS